MKFEDHIIMEVDPEDMDIANALNALSPDERSLKRDKFRKHYPLIELALIKRVTKVKILNSLAKKGLSLSLNTFNKYLANERERNHPVVITQVDDSQVDDSPGSASLGLIGGEGQGGAL